jgi:hypothetical protein
MIFKRDPHRATQKELTRIQKRLQMMPAADIVGWIETSIYSISKNMSHWQKSQNSFFLEEARMSAEVLHEAIENISRRDNA